MIAANLFKELKLYLGIPISAYSRKEILLGSITALMAILSVIYFSQLLLSYLNIAPIVSSNIYVLVSIAATSVLVFVVPHGSLSQPWQVLGGNLSSALIGVLCWKYLNEHLMIAAALSVSLSILVMSYLRCVHPPGGATALGALMGGEAIHNLGFNYIFVPTLLNCIIIIFSAIVLNYPFRWRRYPAHLHFKNNLTAKVSPGDRENEITLEDFLKAVNEHDSYIDITNEGWIEIFENAKCHAESDNEHPNDIALGNKYSNGKIGKKWEIRQVSAIENQYIVKFNIVAGINTGLSGYCSISDFLNWSKFEVSQNTHGVWVRKNTYDQA